MPVYLELVTDAFEEQLNRQKNKRTRDARSARAGRRIARRPTRGIEVKDDTAAAVKVVKADGTELPLVDSSSPDGETTSGYANFILQQVQEQRMEKHQIVETFGAAYVFFFGESPRFLNVQSIILNTHDFNWEAEWWENYERYFRGTKLVELGARLYMFYDDNIVEGYMLNASASKLAEQPHMLQLQFQLFVTNYRNVSFVGNPRFPVRASAQLPPGVELTRANAGEALVNAYSTNAKNAQSEGSVGALGQEIHDLINEGGFGPKNRLSAFLRSVPPTIGISPDTQRALNSIAGSESDGLDQITKRDGYPIRGLIAENVDEYVGQPGSAYFQFEPGGRLPPGILPTIRDAQEVENLLMAVNQFLSCYGVNVDNPSAYNSLGLLPRMDPSRGATYVPRPSSPFGFGLEAEVVGTASAGFSFGAPKTQDPLGAVYGRSVTDERRKDNRFTQGAGDARYGLPSDYASGPGFGQAGYGLQGGFGFGSGQGSGGDPGFRDPNTAPRKGVDNRSAFQRFLATRKDNSQFGTGAGLGVGTGGRTGNASFQVEGKASAFAFVSLEGTLNVFGGARQDPSNISNANQQRLLGFGDPAPRGNDCPVPGDGAGDLKRTTGNQPLAAVGLSLSFP